MPVTRSAGLQLVVFFGSRFSLIYLYLHGSLVDWQHIVFVSPRLINNGVIHLFVRHDSLTSKRFIRTVYCICLLLYIHSFTYLFIFF